MRSRKRRKIRIERGPILMAFAVLWLGYRALTAPGDLTRMSKFVSEPGQPSKTQTLLKQTALLQSKIDEEHAALEDLGSPDGISRLPAGYTPTVPFSALKTHCPALKKLPLHTWIEIDETGQVLSPAMALKGCQFEPFRDPNGRPLAVRTLYTVAK